MLLRGAGGHQLRWLRDRRYAGDYIDFLYEHGGNDRHFSEAIADAAYARFLVDGKFPEAGATRRAEKLSDTLEQLAEPGDQGAEDDHDLPAGG